jgi:lipopolysaccharide export system permease protein
MKDLFPSRTLTLYLSRMFITRIFAVLVMLVMVLQVLDLLSETGAILRHEGNGQAQIWHYVMLRVPQLVARFLPYSVLLATLFTFFPLNQNSEVIAMRAGGLSAHQILAPMLATAMVVSGISFVFNEVVVARSTSQLKAWQNVQYAPLPDAPALRTNIYVSDGRSILAADLMSGTGAKLKLERVTWYERDAGGMVTSRTTSPRASFAAPGWRLEKPERFDVASGATTRSARGLIAPEIFPRQLEMMGADADRMNIFELTRAINTLKASGRRTAGLDAKWWHKFSGPLSALLMPLLGSVAAFGLARSGQLFLRAILGLALGFTYFVVDNLSLAVGNFGGYPPMVAAWAPFVLFFLVGETVLVRTEE